MIRKRPVNETGRAGSRLVAAVKPHSEQFEAVIDEAVAELLGDQALEGFELGIDELDDLAGLDVDHVVVMRLGRGFVAGAAIAEVVPVEDAGFFEQANGAVDGRDRDAWVARGGAFVQFLDVGVVLAFRQHLGNDPALVSDPEATLGAERLDVDGLVHVRSAS